MNRFIHHILLIASLLFISCIDEDFVPEGSLGEGEVCARLEFGHKNYEEIEVSTRATLSEIAESRVENLFVYISQRLTSQRNRNCFKNRTLTCSIVI